MSISSVHQQEVDHVFEDGINLRTEWEYTMEFSELTPEQKAEIEACETPEQILAFAKKAGIKLTDQQVEELTGGSNWGGSCFLICKIN